MDGFDNRGIMSMYMSDGCDDLIFIASDITTAILGSDDILKIILSR